MAAADGFVVDEEFEFVVGGFVEFDDGADGEAHDLADVHAALAELDDDGDLDGEEAAELGPAAWGAALAEVGGGANSPARAGSPGGPGGVMSPGMVAAAGSAGEGEAGECGGSGGGGLAADGGRLGLHLGEEVIDGCLVKERHRGVIGQSGAGA